MSIEVPNGWREARIGQIAEEISTRNHTSADLPVLSMTKHQGFVRSNEYFSKTVHSENTGQYKVVKRGQFAYATIHLDEGSIDYLKNEAVGLISPMYTVFETNHEEIDPEIALRKFKRFAVGGRFDPYSNGGVNRRKSILFRDLSAFKFALPPLSEQHAIVEVLQALDAVILETETVIEQLERTRTEIARLAFSNPPEGSTTTLLKDVIGSIDAGVSVGGELRPLNGGEYGVLRTSSVSSGTFRPDQIKVIADCNLERVSIKPRADRIIISRANTPNLVGASAYVGSDYENLYLSDKLWQIDVADRGYVCVRWLALVLGSPRIRQLMRLRANGTSGSMQNISKSALLSMSIRIPPIAFQKAIGELANNLETRLVLESLALAQLRRTNDAVSQELLSGRVRLTDSIIARHYDKAGQAA
jgi:type I restriction enzyme S subunit